MPRLRPPRQGRPFRSFPRPTFSLRVLARALAPLGPAASLTASLAVALPVVALPVVVLPSAAGAQDADPAPGLGGIDETLQIQAETQEMQGPAQPQAASQPASQKASQNQALSDLVAEQEYNGPVSLVADTVSYDKENATLTAEGNVQIFYGPRTLTASRIVYYRDFDRIQADGPIMLRGPEKATIIASFAELDASLRNGLIRSARAVMEGDAKFAATEGRRIDGRWNVFSQAVFSPCRVCPEDPTPLWRIRAKRIIHDEQSRTVHYEDATFEVAGQPIFWTPYFRHPDPTLERASGLLPPIYQQSTNYGYAIKQPYYWVIDEQTDATLTPFVTTDDGLIMEGEIRHVAERGSIALWGAVSQQDYDGSDKLRGAIFGQGLYHITDKVDAGFSLQQASDDGFLLRYDYTEMDRLESELFLRASDERGYGDLSLVRFQSLRDDEPSGKIPAALPVVEGRRVWQVPYGAQFGVDVAGYALKRTDGQDTQHGYFRADLEKSWILDPGIQVTALGALRGDAWAEQDQSRFDPDHQTRLLPIGALEARMPFVRRDQDGDLLSPLLGGGGVTHVLEPIVQGVISPYISQDPLTPDEDSTLVEFDETNLFDIHRYPGYDGYEEGPRLNIGFRYARIADTGPRFSFAGGRVFRPSEINSFPEGLGLNKRESDYVAAWTLDFPGMVKVSNRVRVGDDLELNRNEVYASANVWGFDVAGSYVWLAQDEVTPTDRHEATVEGTYDVTTNWFVGGEMQRDLENERWVQVEGLVGYANECVNIGAYIGRRFTSTADVPAATYFGLRLNLWALGGGDKPGRAAPGACAPRME